MNIFALSKSPIQSALEMLNKHVVKMPTETCQMLHTNILYMEYIEKHGKEPTLNELKVFHSHNDSPLMKPAMLNHPSTIWARQSLDNYDWLFAHGLSLCDEYRHRYDKCHGSFHRIHDCNQYYGIVLRHNYPVEGLTPVTIAMADEYRIENTFDDEWDFVIASYRHYYLEGKWQFAEWKKDRRPEWYPSNWYAKKYNKGCREYNKTNPKYPLTLLEE